MFEVALFGEFFGHDLKAILNRITLNSESGLLEATFRAQYPQFWYLVYLASPMHSREIVFEPIDAHAIREGGEEPVLLRCKKELLEPNSGWYVRAYRIGGLF